MKNDFPSPEEFKGAVLGTCLYLALYMMIFVPFQSFSKFYLLAQKKREAKDGKKVSFREVKYYNSKDVLALAGDRAVGNFLEFAIVFLPLLWMHAIFVDPGQSFRICLVYTVARAIYPVTFLMGLPYIFISTFPAYMVIGYLFMQLLSNV